MSDIQETYAILQEIDKLLSSIELKINNISGKDSLGRSNGGTDWAEIRKEMRMLNASLTLLTSVTGSDTLEGAGRELQRITLLAIRARLAISAVKAAMVPGVGLLEFGWAAFNIANMGIGVYDVITGVY